MGKPPKHKGVKSHNIITKELDAKEHGTPINEGKKWTHDELDILITGLVWEWGWPRLSRQLRRSRKSLKTFGWKLLDRTYTKGYVPYCLKRRDIKVWNETELDILKMCMRKVWDREMIARALGRSESAVAAKIEDIQGGNRTSFGYV